MFDGSNYNAMLGNALKSYTAIYGGYSQAAQAQEAAQAQLRQGYQQLQGNVLGGLNNAGAHRSQEIADQYTALAGRQNQDLISRGLGNSTVASSVGRGLGYDQAKAQTQLSGQVADMKAQYLSQLGLAGLRQQGQDYENNTRLRMQQLGYGGDFNNRLLGLGAQGPRGARGGGQGGMPFGQSRLVGGGGGSGPSTGRFGGGYSSANGYGGYNPMRSQPNDPYVQNPLFQPSFGSYGGPPQTLYTGAGMSDWEQSVGSYGGSPLDVGTEAPAYAGDAVGGDYGYGVGYGGGPSYADYGGSSYASAGDPDEEEE